MHRIASWPLHRRRIPCGVPVKMPALGVVGALVLAIGLYLAVAGRSRLYPGLVIGAGCVCLATFLLINEAIWPDPTAGPRGPMTEVERWQP